MRGTIIRKWLFVVTSGGMLLGAGGCPDSNQALTASSNAVQGIINTLFGIWVSNGVNTAFGV